MRNKKGTEYLEQGRLKGNCSEVNCLVRKAPEGRSGQYTFLPSLSEYKEVGGELLYSLTEPDNRHWKNCFPIFPCYCLYISIGY